MKSLNIDSKFIDFSCILQKSWLLKGKVYHLVFTINPSTSASTNTASTTAHISLWKQPWCKHKHECKLKHKHQNFFLFLVLIVLTVHIDFHFHFAYLPYACHCAGALLMSLVKTMVIGSLDQCQYLANHVPTLHLTQLNSNLLPVDCCWVRGGVSTQLLRSWHWPSSPLLLGFDYSFDISEISWYRLSTWKKKKKLTLPPFPYLISTTTGIWEIIRKNRKKLFVCFHSW